MVIAAADSLTFSVGDGFLVAFVIVLFALIAAWWATR
jgi:hypothetical protein